MPPPESARAPPPRLIVPFPPSPPHTHQTVLLPASVVMPAAEDGASSVYDGLFSSRRTYGHALVQCARTWYADSPAQRPQPATSYAFAALAPRNRWAFAAERSYTLTRDTADGVFGLLPVCNGEVRNPPLARAHHPARPPPSRSPHKGVFATRQDGGWIVCRALPGSAAAASGVPVERNSVLTRVNGVDVGPAAHRVVGGVPSEPDPHLSRISWTADVMPLLVEAGTTCEVSLV